MSKLAHSHQPTMDQLDIQRAIENGDEDLIPLARPAESNRKDPVMSEAAAQYLFALLDDIDTVGDIAKSDDKLYRELVEKIQRKRFNVGTTDGYEVTIHDPVEAKL